MSNSKETEELQTMCRETDIVDRHEKETFLEIPHFYLSIVFSNRDLISILL